MIGRVTKALFFLATIVLIVHLYPKSATSDTKEQLKFESSVLRIVTVGLLTTEGVTRTIENWNQTQLVINERLSKTSGLRIRFHPYSSATIRTRIASQEIDLFFSDSATFVWARKKVQARQLLSGATMWRQESIEKVGATLFRRSDQRNIQSFRDLIGKKIMSTGNATLDGWYLFENELGKRRIDAAELLPNTIFSNGNEREIVYAVQNGMVDVGIVPAGVLERLAATNTIDLRDFEIVGRKAHSNYPFEVSTALFPGWALAAVGDVSEKDLALIIETFLAVGGPEIVWQAPVNHQKTQDLMIALRVSPFESFYLQAALRIYQKYKKWIWGTAFLIFASVLFLIHELRRNLRLLESSRDVLKSERRSKLFYRGAIEDHTLFCMLSKSGKITHANAQLSKATNFSANSLKQMQISEIITPEAKQVFDEKIKGILESGAPWNGVLELKTKNGGFVLAQCSLIPVEDVSDTISEIAVVASDVTQTFKSVSSSRFNGSLELIGDRVIVLDPEDLEVLYLNRAAKKHFKKHSDIEEFEGCNVQDLVTDSEFESLNIRGDIVASGPQRRMTWEIIDDGQTQLEVSIEYVEPPNDDGRLVVIYRDITERRAAEKAKSEFISTISHELRTPLTSVKGALGLVLSGKLGETPTRITDLVSMANSNCDRLVMLINDVLDLEKIEAGKMDYSMKPIDVAEVVEESIGSNRFFAEKFGVSLKTNFTDGENGYMVSGDKNRLSQVLDNLLSNASKFSHSGEVVEIKLSRNETSINLEIEDRGCGIPEASQSKIFDKFTQADSSDTRSKGGTGLGLAIVKMIVDAHLGEINFRSIEGKGTVFHVTLPILEMNQSNQIFSGGSGEKHLGSVDHFSIAQKFLESAAKAGLKSNIHSRSVPAKFVLDGTGKFGNESALEWLSKRSRNTGVELAAHSQLLETPAYAISLEPKSAEIGVNAIIGAIYLWLSSHELGVSAHEIGLFSEPAKFVLPNPSISRMKSIEDVNIAAKKGNLKFVICISLLKSASMISVFPITKVGFDISAPALLISATEFEKRPEKGKVSKFANAKRGARGRARRAS